MTTFDFMKELVGEGEALAEFTTEGDYVPGYCIIPDDVDTDWLDIAGCLEETLHRILEYAEDLGKDPEEAVFEAARMLKDLDREDALEIDLGYRLRAILTFRRIPLTDIALEKKLYERYKLIWMADHNITLRDAFCEFGNALDPANGGADIVSYESLFEEWEDNSGFSGSEYSCFGEFVQAEYQFGDDRLFQTRKEKRLWLMDQDPESDYFKDRSQFDCVLYIAPFSSGFTPDMIAKMAGMFPESQALLPVTFMDDNENTSAIGFLTEETANKLDGNYLPIRDYIAEIMEKVLGDPDAENSDGRYTAHLRSAYDPNGEWVKVRICMRYGF